MLSEFMYTLELIAAILAGAVIGIGFGMLQDFARRRNEKKQAEGKLNTGWVLIPGSGARVAYLLLTLVAIQIVCPLLFRDGTQWWVSGGLVCGYGLTLFLQLRQRIAKNK
jgi:hypothetical protein